MKVSDISRGLSSLKYPCSAYSSPAELYRAHRNVKEKKYPAASLTSDVSVSVSVSPVVVLQTRTLLLQRTPHRRQLTRHQRRHQRRHMSRTMCIVLKQKSEWSSNVHQVFRLCLVKKVSLPNESSTKKASAIGVTSNVNINATRRTKIVKNDTQFHK